MSENDVSRALGAPRGVRIAGVGMTRFGKQPGRGIKALAQEATQKALEDASGVGDLVSRIYFGNAAAGTVSSQVMIRGQVAFRNKDIATLPVINVENACASGSSAFFLGWEAVATGVADAVLVVGVEQMTHVDKQRTFDALRGSTDIDEIGERESGDEVSNSVLMDFYAAEAQEYLDDHDAKSSDLAAVAVKNRENGSRNPLAQYGQPQTIDEVLQARMVVPPLTLPMCSPVTDGGAAVVLCAEDLHERVGRPTPKVLASTLVSGSGKGSVPVARAAKGSYETASLGPSDLDVIELHDAAAPAELIQYADIGLCDEGDGYQLIRSGATALDGSIPVNTSGGLMSRGHPLGATGCAQIIELTDQLMGRATGRQLPNARTAMAVNGGGWLDGEYAAAVATILQID